MTDQQPPQPDIAAPGAPAAPWPPAAAPQTQAPAWEAAAAGVPVAGAAGPASVVPPPADPTGFGTPGAPPPGNPSSRWRQDLVGRRRGRDRGGHRRRGRGEPHRQAQQQPSCHDRSDQWQRRGERRRGGQRLRLPGRCRTRRLRHDHRHLGLGDHDLVHAPQLRRCQWSGTTVERPRFVDRTGNDLHGEDHELDHLHQDRGRQRQRPRQGRHVLVIGEDSNGTVAATRISQTDGSGLRRLDGKVGPARTTTMARRRRHRGPRPRRKGAGSGSVSAGSPWARSPR